METKTYHIRNINCMHCVHTIKMELEQLAGVKNVEGDIANKTIKVQFEPPATEKLIKDLLVEINYPAD